MWMRFGVTALLYLSFAAGPGLATEYFVAPAPLGDEANPATRERPRADAQAVIWGMKPGDTLTLLPGTYTKGFTFAKSGTPELPITVRAVGTGVVIDGSGESTGGFDKSLISISANHVILEGLQLKRSPGWGVSVWGKHHVTIRNNTITESWHGGINAAFTDLTTVHDIAIENNTLRGNCRSNAEHKSLGGWPASITLGGSQCKIAGNLVEQGHGEGIAIGGDGIAVEKNVVQNHFSACIYLDNATRCVVRENFAYQGKDAPYYSAGKEPGYLSDGRSISTGIQLANEKTFHGKSNPCADNVIEKNTVSGAKAGFYFGEYQKGGGMKRCMIRDNLFLNGYVELIHIDPSSGHEGNQFTGNRFMQTSDRPWANFKDVAPGLVWTRNEWMGQSSPTWGGSR